MKKLALLLFFFTAMLATAQESDQNDETELKEVPNDFLDMFDSERSERPVQTVTNLIVGFGWNQALDDDNGIGEDYRFWGSGIFELGLEFSTRISPNDKLRLNYGLSMQSQTLRITDKRQFVTIDDITSLQPIGFNVDKSKFEQFTLIAPVHLELGGVRSKPIKAASHAWIIAIPLLLALEVI